jgi:gluconokinase
MTDSVVVMGVAGCGKSSLGAALAQDLGLCLLEGDDRHSASSREKMRQGIALTDADRAGWLDELAGELRARPQGLVLTCSALRRAYRDRLRSAAPGLRFIYLEISREEALARVAARAAHFFSASLVDSQFATLEPPLAEPGVLPLDAALPTSRLVAEATAWMRAREAA